MSTNAYCLPEKSYVMNVPS